MPTIYVYYNSKHNDILIEIQQKGQPTIFQ